MSKKKIILFSLFNLLAIFMIIGFFLTSRYKQEKVIVEQAKFEIKILQEDESFTPTGITSKNIKKVNILKTSDAKGVEIILDEEGRKLFEKITAKNKGKQLGLFIDDTAISLPYIQEAIQGGRLEIAGVFTGDEILNLKARLLGYFYIDSEEYKNFQIQTSQQDINKNIVLTDKIEVRASHLLICYSGTFGCDNATLTKEEALEKIKKLKLKATPENFAELVANNSTEPGAKENKGELGWFARGVMVKSFEDAIFNGEVGKIIGPVETEFGFHLIYKVGER